MEKNKSATGNRSRWSVRMLAAAAICIAMSMLLSYLKLFSMPTGGSITVLSMLPLMFFSWIYGVIPGMVAGAAYGLLQLLQRPELYHPIQVLFDYPLAFAMMGLAGVFRGVQKPWALPAGVVLACLGRFVCHLFTGMVFFGSYAPAQDFWSIFVYSAVYNGGYMGVEALLSAAVSALPPVRQMLQRLRQQS